ncbi:MAG: asparagine synthase (glutamine-hydrolyzing) [Bacteroidia bacterium]
MCGISGFFVQDNFLEYDDLVKMTEVLAHRGPDTAGYFSNHQVALGHRRLSIIDLSPAANQPFYSSDKRFVIVFNGEIYNFKELSAQLQKDNSRFIPRTSSDTEILVEAFAFYGPEFVKKLNGIFAFAIYDTIEKKMYLYRDHLGVKPVYYYWNGKQFAFASELKSFRAIRQKLNLQINKQVISTFLHLGYIPAPHSIYQNVYKLLPGHLIEVHSGTLTSKQFWKIDDAINSEILENEQEVKSGLHDLIVSSVKYQMMSDVPFGTFLSGGIDSSLVTAVAQSLSSSPINTFSIGFDYSKYDESVWAKKIAQTLNTNHHEFRVTTKDAQEHILDIIDMFDEPFADSSALPTMLVASMAKQHVKMTLSGDGGDELFLGYGMYTWAKRLNNPVLANSRKLIVPILSLLGGRYARAAKVFKYNSETKISSHLFSQEQYLFSEHEINSIVKDEFKGIWDLNENFSSLKRGIQPEEKQALFDLKYYLPDDLLVKVDRATMYNSIETRVPLLDYRVVEYALNISPELKIKYGEKKYILKQILYEYLPKELFERPKWGFSIPLNEWLSTDLNYLIQEYLNQSVVEKTCVLKFTFVHNIVREFKNGNSTLFNRVWVMVILHYWLNKNEL